MCYSHYDHSLLMRDVEARVAGVQPAKVTTPRTGLASVFSKVKTAILGLLTVGVLSSCGGPQAASVARLEGAADDGKISVMFQEFDEGTRCIVQTPRGQLLVDKMPGKIEYPALYRASGITCKEPNGDVYAVNVESSLPASFKTAGVTVYPDGRLFATISGGPELVQIQEPMAVRRLN